MKYEIKNKITKEVIFSAECESLKVCVEMAIKAKTSLGSADLRFADLSSADLSYADLRFADLSSADLSYADLRFTNLRFANLSSADLSYADLRSANLSSADLSYADLSSADLRFANLSYADLRFANLSSADLRSANLSSADLSSADLIVFQFQKHWCYYTFDGSLRIGCILMPVSEWVLGFKEIGKKEKYTDEQILIYGNFIKMCHKHFLRNTK